MRLLRFALIALAGSLLTVLPSASAQVDVSPDAIERVIPATVKIWILNRQEKPMGSCSGSVVSPAGVILTASHCVRATEDEPPKDLPAKGLKRGQFYRAGELYNPQGLLLLDFNLPGHDLPVPSYYAKLIADAPGLAVLDLAIAQIVAPYDSERRPLTGRLHLPAVPIGDSSRLRIGERIAVLGFPDIGGSTITVVKGNVVGFYPDYRGNPNRFLKEDSMASPGHSGGPIINAAGVQIAVVSSGQTSEYKGAQIGYNPMTGFIPKAWQAYLAGIPAGPASAPSQVGGQAVLTGVIRDAATGKGIPDASIVLYRAGVDPDRASTPDTLADGVTDDSGRYRTGLVPKGATYPVDVFASGYRGVRGTVTVSTDSPDVMQMNEIELRKF